MKKQPDTALDRGLPAAKDAESCPQKGPLRSVFNLPPNNNRCNIYRDAPSLSDLLASRRNPP
jgi:hypothetical protein